MQYNQKLDRYTSLSYDIAHYLRTKILNGGFVPGERLYEAKIAKELGVSRSPIREAFRQLEHEGLVTIIPRKGVRVFQLVAKDIQEIIELRLLLEEHVLKVLIEEERISTQNISTLRMWLDEMNEKIADKEMSATEIFTTINRYDMAFHSMLWELTARPRFVEMLKNLMIQSKALLVLTNSLYEDQQRIIDEHYQILHALEKRDLEEAKKELRNHVIYAQNLLLLREN
ncbi:MAG: GntR family transcriptional regulator [bacterium]|jgi:DNA-binding GntR family transcriptional regulator